MIGRRRAIPERHSSRRSPVHRRLPFRQPPVGTSSEQAADHRMLIRRRTTVLLVFLMLALAGLVARLAQLQVVEGGRLQRIAERQQLGSITLDPHRGRVLDRRGRALAINVEATSIYAVPSAISDRHAFAAIIAPAVGLSADDVEQRLSAGRYFAWLARKVSPEVVARVKALNLGDQIGFLTEDRRAYPNGSLAAHLLGFVGIDNQGLAGVELTYDEMLRGTAGKAVSARDGIGRILVETQQLLQAPRDGVDIVLTIDQVIQHIAERELEKAIARTGAHQGSVTVIDPTNGEILALAVYPAFDPSRGTAARPAQWNNRVVTEAYEPGSTFKVFLAAAVLETGTVSPTERFFCNGSLVVGDHVIRDAHNKKHGWQTMADIIKNSCNVGAAQMATKLGKQLFYNYIRNFGFGQQSGIDLPGEARGIVPPPSAWLGPGLQTIAFGQGVSTTAVQLVAAATALVNDGVIVRPHVVRAVRDSEGRMIKVVGREPVRQVIRPETAQAVLRMMVGTVEDGTGTQARIDGYTVAGKTGTAQKPSRFGGYDPNRFVASFLGIAPVEDPRLAILVVLDEPRGEHYGGEVAAPVFREVAAQTLWYLRVPPRQNTTGNRGSGNSEQEKPKTGSGD